MVETSEHALERIAEALERLAPPAPAAAAFDRRRACSATIQTAHAFIAAPDYGLALDLLVGIDRQKDPGGRGADAVSPAAFQCNHVLLWGVRGAGKSSLAQGRVHGGGRPGGRRSSWSRSIATRSRPCPTCSRPCANGPSGSSCYATTSRSRRARPRPRRLKSALEGGVAGPPENVLFVATSNRRHLMPRDHVESRGAIATAEDAEEEVSVSDRFGLWIGFPPMDQATYLAAVVAYAERFGLATPTWSARALRWAQAARRPIRPRRLAVHPRPGRRARQTVAHLELFTGAGPARDRRAWPCRRWWRRSGSRSAVAAGSPRR